LYTTFGAGYFFHLPNKEKAVVFILKGFLILVSWDNSERG